MSDSYLIAREPQSFIDRKLAIGRLLLGIFIFLLPVVKFIEIEIGGRLFLTEIILFILFMFMLVSRRIQFKSKPACIFVMLCLLWLYGQIITDLVRDTSLIDFARGWAKIVFTLTNFAVLFMLLHGKKRSIAVFAAGLATGGILEYFLNPGIYALDNPWKFGFGMPVTLLSVLTVTAISPNKSYVRVGLLLSIFAINMYMGFRSLAGICFLTAVYVYMQSLVGSQSSKIARLSFKGALKLGTMLLAASLLLIEGYGYMARQGILGARAEQLYRLQGYGMLGVLLGGRSEILSSGRAIFDSPFIGHGSWAKDVKYVDALIMSKRRLGYYAAEQDESELIPTHSHLFGAWVEAGILGAVFWCWLLSLALRCLSSMYRTNEWVIPLYAFICFCLIWDIFFSPYAGDRRFITQFYIVTLMTAATEFIKDNNLVAR